MSGILYREEDHVAWVTIDRQHVANALDGESEAEMRRIWDDLEGRRDIWAAVLTGAGERVFCAGSDMSASAVTLSGIDYWLQERPGGFGGIACRRTLDIPVIAAVNGHALGGGLEMVLGCDIVIAAEEARLGLPEPTFGRLPLDGGLYLLSRQLPHHLAMGMLLTARQVPAAEAARYGLVNEGGAAGSTEGGRRLVAGGDPPLRAALTSRDQADDPAERGNSGGAGDPSKAPGTPGGAGVEGRRRGRPRFPGEAQTELVRRVGSSNPAEKALSTIKRKQVCRSRSGVGRIRPPRGSTREARRPNDPGAVPVRSPRLLSVPAADA